MTQLEVTAEDIQNGVRKVDGMCPIALAAVRLFGRACFYSDDWPGDGWALRIGFPESQYVRVIGAEDFAMAYDESKHVEPQTFDLEHAFNPEDPEEDE